MRVPSKQTLDKYHMTAPDFAYLWDKQGGCCAVCKMPLDRRFYIDHFHAPGYASKPWPSKKRYVRGILDYHCNRFLVAKNHAGTIGDVSRYLRAGFPLR